MRRRWKALVAVGAILCFVALGFGYYIYGTFTMIVQRRRDTELLIKRESDIIYHLASKRDFASLEQLRLAPAEDLAALDRKHGKVRAWSIEDVWVGEMGLHGMVLVRVDRNSRQLELVSFMDRTSAAGIHVTDANRWRAIFGDGKAR